MERELSTNSFIRRLLPGGLALALLATACVGDNGTDTDVGQNRTDTTDLSPGEFALTSGLQTVQSCDGLLDRLVAHGLERVGPYGFDGGVGWFGVDVMEEEMAMDDAAEAAPTSGDFTASQGSDGEGRSFSGTNNQERGVDEPDIVKTDGERIIIANGNTIRVVAVTDDGPEPEKTIKLGDNLWANEILLNGDTVLVMSNGWTEYPLAREAASADYIYPGGMPTTLITEVDLATGDIERTLEFEGGYLSARDVDGTARIVLTATTGQFPFVFPSNPAAEEAAENANRELIKNSTIDQWLPTYRIVDNDGEVVDAGPIVECDRMHLPGEFSGFGTLAVLTVDLEQGLELKDSLAVLTDGQTIYASTEQLAVATMRWPEWDRETGEVIEDDRAFTTAIHSFDISSDERTEYTASGSVRGHLLNQFSLSEYEGNLRVATTDGSPWWGGGGESESFVTVLGEEGGELKTLGQVGGLGKGEQIFAVRFLGSTAYVVTFEQIDPLYTVDLSDPTEPTVLGELKIPGFSTYLHPIGDGVVLGIGQDATDEGRQTGAQISSFDVSDLTSPKRTDQIGLGRNSYSPIDWDKKAFTWWADTNTAFVPISWWSWNEADQTDDNGSAVVVVDVNEDGTLTERGRINHPVVRSCETAEGYSEELIEPAPPIIEESTSGGGDAEASFVDGEAPAAEAPPAEEVIAPDETRPVEEYCWTYAAEIRRTIVIDDQLYTLSDSGLKATSLDDLSNLGWIAFNG